MFNKMILIMIALILGFVNLVLIYQKAKNILSDWILYIIFLLRTALCSTDHGD